ncbi:MAG TPA: endolytic transglycosylase MltG [Anaerolineales bacterium]|nr:endolytic transglycosylase MltG [Anaerolineales bacterium]
MRNLRLPLLVLLLILTCACLLGVTVWAGAIPRRAEILFGPADPGLSAFDRFTLAWSLAENVDELTLPVDPGGEPVEFTIDEGEPAERVIERLAAEGLVRNTAVFRDYLVYTGADTRLVPGTYTLSPGASALDIAAEIQNIAGTGVTFRILPGWRMEEIAAALPSSGIAVDETAFLAVARRPPSGGISAFWPAGVSHEGLLLPDVYSLPRSLTAESLIGILAENFRSHLTTDLQTGFAAQGLSVFEAVTLASIVEREAVVKAEMPQIAAVFLNRLAIGMKLDADPTVQYALGYSTAWGWWKAPLALSDLQVTHTYNTYQVPALPPGPIANPSVAALEAVAFPEPSDFYYFRAACDGSGRHVYAVTFEEHQANACE